MRRGVSTLIPLMTAGVVACKNATDGFDHIKPSANLTWTPCLSGFTCSKLDVPLDYANPSIGTTGIAFVKLAGKNATADSQSIVIIPGGPGNSGIELLSFYATLIGSMLGEQYNFISYDPRGVGHSGPKLDCFSGNTEARSTFNHLHRTGTTNTSDLSLAQQFSTSSIYGEWCNDAVAKEFPHGYYVTTPAVARDLLAFTEAEARLAGRPTAGAKLWAYGVSYGTVVGTTFATMFPDRVGRMALDGVLDAERYYAGDWSENLEDADKAMETFPVTCHAAGAEKCSFWGPSPEEIASRMEAVIRGLQENPVAVSGIPGRTTPALVTFADLAAKFIPAVYGPGTFFPELANILHQLEGGNASALVGEFRKLDITAQSDARIAIMCADASRGNNTFSTVEDFRRYVDHGVSKSKYLGPIWPIYQEDILCRSVKPQLSASMFLEGPIGAPNTSFPILFTSTTHDPVSPLKFANAMSSRFPGSVVLVQDTPGHVVVNQGGSVCYFGNVQAYFAGVVPAANTTCPQESVPFMSSPGLGR